MTTSYADAFGKKVLQNGEVIAFHTSAYMRDNYFYTVKYDNKLFFCKYDYYDLVCAQMENK